MAIRKKKKNIVTEKVRINLHKTEKNRKSLQKVALKQPQLNIQYKKKKKWGRKRK